MPPVSGADVADLDFEAGGGGGAAALRRPWRRVSCSPQPIRARWRQQMPNLDVLHGVSWGVRSGVPRANDRYLAAAPRR